MSQPLEQIQNIEWTVDACYMQMQEYLDPYNASFDTALSLAIVSKHHSSSSRKAVVQELLDCGASLASPTCQGNNALGAALGDWHADIAQLLRAQPISAVSTYQASCSPWQSCIQRASHRWCKQATPAL